MKAEQLAEKSMRHHNQTSICKLLADTPDIHDRGTLSYRVNVTNGTTQTEISVDATTGVATIDQGHEGRGRGGENDQNEANEITPDASLGSLLPGK